ncbi:glycoside hydrolase family 16 protein [Nocardioides montaniterrae]
MHHRSRRRAFFAALATFVTAVALAAPGRTASASPTSPAATTSARSTAPYCGTAIHKGDGSPWHCTFGDDFGGTTLNGNNWVIGETAKTGFRIGKTCFTKDNVAVGNGHLSLTTKDMGHEFYCGGGPLIVGFFTRYTGAHIATWSKFAQAFGRFSVRSRYPDNGSGLKAGLWMYPQKQVYGKWPNSGELDVSEWWSNTPRQVVPGLHYRGSDWHVDNGWKCFTSTPYRWHTYTLVWTHKEMRFSIDNNTCFRRTVQPDAPFVAPQPFDQPFTMILNMAVGNGNRGNYIDDTSRFPATYQVDWARAWR